LYLAWLASVVILVFSAFENSLKHFGGQFEHFLKTFPAAKVTVVTVLDAVFELRSNKVMATANEARLSGHNYQRTSFEAGKTSGSQVSALKVLSSALLNEVEALEARNGQFEGHINLSEEVKNFEARLIRNALIRTGGRQRRAARLLGVKITTLNAKIKRYGIDWATPRQAGRVN
jgi:DNA-binding NtrC family response regulator